MGRARQKLKSQQGASLMVALLFFVMMAVIGSVILAAASAGMGRVKDEDEGDQERYALYSAAKLVVNAFAGESAFGTNGDTSTANWELQTQAPVSYYIDSESGEYYNDSKLTRKFDSNSTPWPDTGDFFEKPTADNLSEIREALGKAILSKYWTQNGSGKNILTSWEEGTTVNWEDWVKTSSSESDRDEEKKKDAEGETFSFVIAPDQDWTKDTEKGRYKVRVTLVIDPYFNVKGTLNGLPDDQNDTDYLTGQKYFISIPFATEARFAYTCENKQKDVPEKLGNTNRYSTHVSEYRKVSFYDFRWQKTRQATITTVDPDSESSSAAGN